MYQSLPEPPKQFDQKGIFQRMIMSLGFRYQLATDGLTANEYAFDPGHGSMNMQQLLFHIYRLSIWMYSSFGLKRSIHDSFKNIEDVRSETISILQELEEHVGQLDVSKLAQIKITLKRLNKDFDVWYIINGPLADALTHVGQINSWRRMSGNPVPRISPFTGEKY